MRIPFHLLTLGLSALMALPAGAATSPVKLTTQPKASVANSCKIVTLDNLSFGTYDTIAKTDRTANGQAQLHCTKGTAVSVIPTSGGSTLKSAGNTLTYALYTDAAMTKVFGNGGTAAFNSSNYSDRLYFKTVLTAAQFAANPNYAKQVYGYYKSTASGHISSEYYYVGYLGQGAAYATGAAGSMTNNANVGLGSGSVVVSTYVGNATYTYNNNNESIGQYNYLITPGQTVTPTGTVYQIPNYSSSPVTGTVTSINTDLKLSYYGKLPGGQDVVPGAYTDTVTLQVSF